ncbi:MAG: hypothetical protein ACM31K_07790 [Solirubrobacterales bacterium]
MELTRGCGREEEPPNEGNIEAAARAVTTTRAQRLILARFIPGFLPEGGVGNAAGAGSVSDRLRVRAELAEALELRGD